MSSIVIKGNTSGQVELAAPDVAGSTTLTMPTTDGTVITNNSAVGDLPKGPAFSAGIDASGSAQNVSNATWTVVACDDEEYDTNSNYDTTTYRFTPTVAGYYQVNGTIYFTTVGGGTIIGLFKNGSIKARGTTHTESTVNGQGLTLNYLVYMNGSSDYIDLRAYQGSGGTRTLNVNPALNYFQAVLVRAV